MTHRARTTMINQRSLRRSPGATVFVGKWRLLNVLLVGSVVVLGIVYLLIVNDLSTKVYEVRSLRNRLSTVSEDTNRMKRESVEGQSRSELAQAIKAYPFVPEGSLEYAHPSTVALETHSQP